MSKLKLNDVVTNRQTNHNIITENVVKTQQAKTNEVSIQFNFWEFSA